MPPSENKEWFNNGIIHVFVEVSNIIQSDLYYHAIYQGIYKVIVIIVVTML